MKSNDIFFKTQHTVIERLFYPQFTTSCGFPPCRCRDVAASRAKGRRRHNSGGQISEAVRQLGLPRKTLYDKLARHGINPAAYRKRRQN